ncbi:3609_t:CDS:2 [Cetraspora pellucida]|uniref:3609_t:CDS:1 n=1 Tax=Cetraspora pellucida TaxID=1433469 RepID=A0A9N8WBL5_9GLOM|nr:3609_t:CDS:2 [Cetraspora pellucida]
MSKQSAQLEWYGGREINDYSSNSDVYSNNISESGSENCSDYSSDYESDTETSTIKPQIFQPSKVEEQVSNTTSSTEQASPTYTKRQERFDDKFTKKDVMNKICKIVSSLARDMSNNKGSLEDIHLWNYLLSNYRAKEKITPKFSIIDNISEIYGLSRIHECINRQWLLRAVIDINASKEKIEAKNINTKNEEIIKELVIITSSDDSKCSYHFLYTPTLLVDYQELKEFTELVYRLTGEKYEKINQKKIIVGQDSLKRYANLVLQKYSDYLEGWDIEKKNSQYFQNRDEKGEIFNNPSIAEKIQQKNNNTPNYPKIKGPKFLKPFLEMLSWVKCKSLLTTKEVYEKQYVEPLLKEGDVYVGSPWEIGKTYTLEHLTIPDGINLLTRQIIAMNNDLTDLNIEWIKNLHRNKLFSVIHNIYQFQKGKTFRLASNKETVLAELWEWAKQMSSLPSNEQKSASLICHLRKDVQEIVHALRINFPELHIKNYHDKSDLAKKAQDFGNVNETWKERMVDFLKKAGMIISIIKATPKAKDDTMTLTETVKGYSSAIKAKEILDIANANILNHEMARHLENKPKKTLEEIYVLNQYHIADCYGVSPKSITEEFITDYAVEAIICEDYKNDRLTTVTQAEKYQICLELLKTYTPIKDIDDRNRYKVINVKTCLNSSESIQYLQNLVPKMAQIFDNTDASHSAKKSGLKLDKAKLGLLNSALFAIFKVKFKTTNNKNTHYHLVGIFDYKDASKLPPYQTDKGQFYENGEDMHYGYSKLSSDELEPSPNCISQNTQDLFDII